jgi:hypothetical protein
MTYDPKTAHRLALLSDFAYGEPDEATGAAAGIGAEAARFIENNETETLVCKFGPDVFVTYRGTEPMTFWDLLTDARICLKPAEGIAGDVHAGFGYSIGNTWNDTLQTVDSLLGRDGFVYWGGHSKGGAEATLAAARFAQMGRGNVGAVHTFGSPAVGGLAFATEFEAVLGGRVFRHVHRSDLTARSPYFLRLFGKYRPVGKLVYHNGGRTFHPSPIRRLVDLCRAVSSKRWRADHDLAHYIGETKC